MFYTLLHTIMETPNARELMTVRLYHRMKAVSSLGGMHEAGQKVVEKLKELGYLQTKTTVHQNVVNYSFPQEVRSEPLTGDELDVRILQVQDALDKVHRSIPEARGVIEEYQQSL